MDIEKPFKLQRQYTNWLYSQPDETQEQFEVIDIDQLLWNIAWFKQELRKNMDNKLGTSNYQVSDIIKLIDKAFFISPKTKETKLPKHGS